MAKIKTIALNDQFRLTAVAGALFAATFAPLLHNQLVTGSLVNALLFLSCVFLTFHQSILVAAMPSLIALSIGLLPVPLAPMVPYIIASNILLVFLFRKFYNLSWWGAGLGSALLKFLFLLLSSRSLFFFLGFKLPQSVLLMMSYPQFVTALCGLVIAYIFLKGLNKSLNTRSYQ